MTTRPALTQINITFMDGNVTRYVGRLTREQFDLVRDKLMLFELDGSYNAETLTGSRDIAHTTPFSNVDQLIKSIATKQQSAVLWKMQDSPDKNELLRDLRVYSKQPTPKPEPKPNKITCEDCNAAPSMNDGSLGIKWIQGGVVKVADCGCTIHGRGFANYPLHIHFCDTHKQPKQESNPALLKEIDRMIEEMKDDDNSNMSSEVGEQLELIQQKITDATKPEATVFDGAPLAPVNEYEHVPLINRANFLANQLRACTTTEMRDWSFELESTARKIKEFAEARLAATLVPSRKVGE